MASGRKGNKSAGVLHQMTADYGMRAAMALNDFLPGEHRDKLVARMFNVSLRMAKYLRKGQYWTTDRLTQASVEFGAAFDFALAGKRPDLQDIAERLARLEERVNAQVDSAANAQVAREQGGPLFGGRGTHAGRATPNAGGESAGCASGKRALGSQAEVTPPQPHTHRGAR